MSLNEVIDFDLFNFDEKRMIIQYFIKLQYDINQSNIGNLIFRVTFEPITGPLETIFIQRFVIPQLLIILEIERITSNLHGQMTLKQFSDFVFCYMNL